jgi:hypothetical protein
VISSKQMNGQALDLEPDANYNCLHEDEETEHHFLAGHTALQFLLAGGVAGTGIHYI